MWRLPITQTRHINALIDSVSIRVYMKYFVCAIVFSLMLVHVVHASGIGASPAKIVFSNVLQGGYAEAMLRVSNVDDTENLFTVRPGGLAGNWIDIQYRSEPPRELFFVPANSFVDLRVILKPPVDVPIGTFPGEIYILSTATGNVTSTGAGVQPGVLVGMEVSTTGIAHEAYAVTAIIVSDVEEGQPLPITIVSENKGNVRAFPFAAITILDKTKRTVVREHTTSLGEILPTRTESTPINVSTSGLAPDQYWANVTIFLGNRSVATKLVTFDIFEPGSLRTKGELVRIDGTVWSSVGDTLRLVPVFRNIGELRVSATFKGEVYRDTAFVTSVESDTIFVDPGQEVNLTVFFTLQQPGRHELRGYVLYSQKITEEKSFILNVLPRQGFTPNVEGVAIVAMIVIIVGIVIWRLSRSPTPKAHRRLPYYRKR